MNLLNNSLDLETGKNRWTTARRSVVRVFEEAFPLVSDRALVDMK
jgi:hypothetical protein